MPNTYFQFKHFRIDQELCGMKVCTDACILGAVAPVTDAKFILDIGTGTGLLALMAAQRSGAQIDALEIDKQAAAQAVANVAASPWAGRVKVFHLPLQEFAPEKEKRYDLIISNPPFFVNSLRSEKTSERIAKHTDTLSFTEITLFTAKHLSEAGKLCILLPPSEQELFASEAQKNGLYRLSNLYIRDREGGKITRVISVYSFALPSAKPVEKQLIIKQPSGEYSPEFRELLKDFYLAF